ncbi:MAG: hypothetical protein HKO65_05000 [Gemmatimonadetes bacterium]|nr:hypothetical protein [Gemmatimonadota bacterium]NNM04440.1 hypothetical protein [Gemmatimonadota bacterium]
MSVKYNALVVFLFMALPGALNAQGACGPESRAFDFWMGEWDVLNRNRPAEDVRWYDTGTATARVYPVVAGCGLVEHWRGNAYGEFVVGFSLRAFNPQRGQWDLILLWPNSGQPRFGELYGGFRHSRGEFFSQNITESGDTAITRFTFSDITPNTLRWQDGISTDGGRTWDSSWIMEFSRREPLYQGALLNGPAVTTLRCPGPEYRGLDFLIGEWAGAVEADSAEAEGMGVRSNITPILDGCGLMEKVSAVGQTSAWEVFRAWTYEQALDKWVGYWLDTRWPVIQRLEAEVPPAGAPWVFQTVRPEPLDGDLRATMDRGVDGSVTWRQERFNAEAGQWEASPMVAYAERLGAPSQGG